MTEDIWPDFTVIRDTAIEAAATVLFERWRAESIVGNRSSSNWLPVSPASAKFVHDKILAFQKLTQASSSFIRTMVDRDRSGNIKQINLSTLPFDFLPPQYAGSFREIAGHLTTMVLRHGEETGNPTPADLYCASGSGLTQRGFEVLSEDRKQAYVRWLSALKKAPVAEAMAKLVAYRYKVMREVQRKIHAEKRMKHYDTEDMARRSVLILLRHPNLAKKPENLESWAKRLSEEYSIQHELSGPLPFTPEGKRYDRNNFRKAIELTLQVMVSRGMVHEATLCSMDRERCHRPVVERVSHMAKPPVPAGCG
jgi:hypothetical protein